MFGAGTYNTSTLGRSGDVVLEDREDMDQVLLSKFRTELMPQHPFVVIPQHIPAAVMRAHHPLLMMSIRAIAGFEGLAEMQAQMQLATGHMTDRIFRHGERTLDLLMGIVVILGWYHYQCARHNQLNNLLCLAESLVSDLGLNKRPHGGDDEAEEERAVEEKRLLLGVWYLRSSYVQYQHFAIYLPQCPSSDNEHSTAMHLPQLTSMPFPKYMRQCLTELEQAEDHDLDQVLVRFVKAQYSAERVAVLKSPQLRRANLSNDRVSLEGGEQDKESQEEATLTGCQAHLERLARELPIGLRENGKILYAGRDGTETETELGDNHSHDRDSVQHGRSPPIGIPRSRSDAPPCCRRLVELPCLF